MQRVLRSIKGESLRAQLLRGGAGSIVVKTVHLLLSLGITVILARGLGPQGFGNYAYVLALISFIAIPITVSLPKLILRETAKAHLEHKWALMRGIWRWSNSAVVLYSLLAITVVTVIAVIARASFSHLQLATLAWGLAALPLLALGNIRSAAVRGLHRVVMGQLPEMVLRPALHALLLLLALLLVFGESLTAAHAMALYSLAAAISFAAGAWMLHRARPVEFTQSAPVYETKLWLSSIIPLALTASLRVLTTQTDIIMLGIFSDAEQVGVYRVAAQGSLLVSFGLQAVNMMIAPHFARLYSEGNMERLQKVVMASARAILVFTLPVVIVFFLFGKEILTLVFGEEYALAYTPLVILCLGQLVSATMGSVISLLNMTGHERDAVSDTALAALFNIILNAILIPAFGIHGAAIATSVTLAIWNVALCRKVWQKLGIQSAAFRIWRTKAEI